MSAGTITLTNHSDLVVGAGTAFTSDLAAGDIIVAVVGGVTYTLPVKRVESDTSATLIKAYDGPTQAGSAWTAVPRDTLSTITAQLGAEAVRALRGFNYDKQNWQQVFSETRDITVMLPDGSTFDGPSWLKVVELLREIDLDAITEIAKSVNTDAQQVSTDKDIVVAAKESASASATSAESSKNSASSSAAAAGNSATAAAGSESNAASSAASAKADADRVAAANPDKALLKENNLSDLASASDALENLGLGNSSTKNTGTSSAEIMQPGMFGIGRPDGVLQLYETNIDSLLENLNGYGLTVLRNNSQTSGPWYLHAYSPILFMRASDTYTMWNAPIDATGPIRVFGGTEERGWVTVRDILDSVTTTTDSNGFIKKASPVVKLFGDGGSEPNSEAEGVTSERISEGVYRLSGAIMGFCSDSAWHIEVPTDENKQPLVWVDYEIEPTGDVIVKTYHRTHPTAPAFARNERDGYDDGEPIDIPIGRWVDLRVQVSSD